MLFCVLFPYHYLCFSLCLFSPPPLLFYFCRLTHISVPKISTACINALKNILGTLGFAPSLPKNINICIQIFLEFRRFPTANGKY